MADHRNGSAQAANGKASAAGTAYSIDLNAFQTRLRSFYQHWDAHKLKIYYILNKNQLTNQVIHI